MAVTMLALGQAAYLFNARSLRESSLRRDMLTGNPVRSGSPSGRCSHFSWRSCTCRS